ncbi:hypothetical protein INT45_004395 [Circinella minor]|uniref:DUF7137 domain-containing protein n=1 Tax=Circinella minor TaxID=1195481 RepID=A0A8H7S9H7_9FUNG|nr:hypothetical protein INT45_004395 [Circinella minor]
MQQQQKGPVLLRKRQETPAESSQAQAQPAPTQSNNVNTAPQATATSGSAAPVASGSAGAGGNNTDSLAGLPTSASFGNSIYPGAATFATPKPSGSVSPLYRIDPKENITFAWSFTNLRVQPANLTLAALGPNSVTYTISAMAGAATSAVWHLSDIPTNSPALMNGYYQIQLYDQRGVSAFPAPGWLSPLTTLSIAFYTGEVYTDSTATIGDACPTCFYDGAIALGSAFGLACIIVAIYYHGRN